MKLQEKRLEVSYTSVVILRLLIAVLIPITLTIQVGQVETMGPLFKNAAILGGLLFSVLIQIFNIKNNEKLKYKK